MYILYIVKEYNYYNYYTDIIKYLKKYAKVDVKLYRNNISLLLDGNNYDKIILGFSMTNTGYDSPPLIKNDTNIPVYIILNKEYSALDKKLHWIKNIKPVKCFSVHHDIDFFQKKTGIPFYRISWSAESKIFRDYGEKYVNDVFFSGVIRKEQKDNIRYKIYKNIHKLRNMKINFNVNIFNYSNGKYAKELAKSKIGLITTGPADLVGTRYFEIMAGNRCLILCNRMSNNIYNKIVIDGFNCIMFDNEDDFIEKCKYYIIHEEERIKIVNQAYKYFLEKHTWDHKVKELLENC